MNQSFTKPLCTEDAEQEHLPHTRLTIMLILRFTVSMSPAIVAQDRKDFCRAETSSSISWTTPKHLPLWSAVRDIVLLCFPFLCRRLCVFLLYTSPWIFTAGKLLLTVYASRRHSTWTRFDATSYCVDKDRRIFWTITEEHKEFYYFFTCSVALLIR